MVKPSETLGYELVPNWGGNNSLGMSDKEREAVKNPGTYRIMILGDSVVESSKFPECMEKTCNNSENLKNIEVWDCAVIGYNTIQQCILLREKFLKYEPDMVIVGFCSNDFNATPVIAKYRDRLVGFYPKDTTVRFNYFLLKRSALYRFVMNRICAYKSKSVDLKTANQNNVYKHLSDVSAILSERDIALILVVLPELVEYEKNIQNSYFNDIKKCAKI
ncbi:hypothetical protein ACFLTD_02310 [Elusimicrobiota bacterium]